MVVDIMSLLAFLGENSQSVTVAKEIIQGFDKRTLLFAFGFYEIYPIFCLASEDSLIAHDIQDMDDEKPLLCSKHIERERRKGTPPTTSLLVDIPYLGIVILGHDLQLGP